MKIAPSRRCPLALASAVAFALFLVWGASSQAEEPEEPVAPLALYALAPDSSAASSGPAANSSEPPTSSLTTDGGTPPPVTPAEVAASVAPAAAAEPTAPPKLEQPPAPKPETTAAKQPTAKRVKKAKPAASAAKKPKAPSTEAKPSAKPTAKASAEPTLKPDASPPDEGVRARQELERTEAILRSVKAKVVRSFNKKAREEFETATTRQREAREALGENLYARAERLTLEARGIARTIAVHLGPPEDDADYVSMTLDRTDDALSRAREVLREAGDAAERARLAALERRQKDARQLQKDGSTRRAYASTREVRDGVLTLLRDCDDLPVREETAEKALKRATRSMEQAKGELGERLTAGAQRLAREASAQMEKARVAFARKNYRDTLLHSKLVERNLELAVSAQRSSTNRSG